MGSVITDEPVSVAPVIRSWGERQVAAVILTVSAALMFTVVSLLPDEIPRDPGILLRPFPHHDRHAYLSYVIVPFAKPDSHDNWKRSTLLLYEDGKLMGPQHVSSDDISEEGHGSYLFWRDADVEFIMFSASDNSDPNTNGRVYGVFDPEAKDPFLPVGSGASGQNRPR